MTPRKSTRSARVNGYATRVVHRIQGRNPRKESALQLLRMTEANDAIQRRIGDLRETSDERRRLENALYALNLLHDRPA
jgi:hypothetical protein